MHATKRTCNTCDGKPESDLNSDKELKKKHQKIFGKQEKIFGRKPENDTFLCLRTELAENSFSSHSFSKHLSTVLLHKKILAPVDDF